MFTGLIEETGTVVDRRPTTAGFRVRVSSAIAGDLSPGESLAVNGVCLTVTRAEAGEVHADIGPETARVSTLGDLAPGAIVNLERPLRADGRLGGHFVQGHVDGVGQITAVRPEADFTWMTIGFPHRLSPYIVHKGSIAVDGVSLTVARLGGESFDVQLVPFTLERTNLGRARVHDRVNLECDMVGKYVVRAAELAGLTLDAVRSGEAAR